MAQREPNEKSQMMTFRQVKIPKLRPLKSLNDNDIIPSSGLTFREQKRRIKRSKDLSWQVKFSTMKLKSWRNLENPAWGPLHSLRETAEQNLDELGLV